MSKGVSLLDSISLCFVVAHFCFLLWAQGHLLTIQAQEAEYKAAAATYNEKAEKISGDSVRIAEEITKAARETTKAERLRNDTAYQERRAAEARGAKRPRAVTNQTGQSTAPATAPAMAPIELEKPKPPEQSSAAFLMKWDAWIRGANFGELILAAVSLIFIRNRSAKFNAERAVTSHPMNYQDDFPDEIEADITRDDRSGRRFDRTRKSGDERNSLTSGDSFDRKKARLKLLENLKVISSYHYGYWFRVELLDDGGVKIRMSRRVNGVEETVATTRQSDKLLLAVDRPDFLKRLVDELTRCGFPIEKDKMNL